MHQYLMQYNINIIQIKKQAGVDRVRLVISGSAALTDKVSNFLRILLSAPLLEGYGQTETCGAATLMFNDDYSSGHVGGPISSCEIRVVDAPDMNYFVTDTEHCGEKVLGRGEICFRGNNIFLEYYKDKKSTNNTIDKEGWHHTGDCVCILPNYALKVLKYLLQIIDRKSNIIKLSQGEFVATENLENIYGQSNFIAQIYIHGESSKATIVSIIVPDFEYIAKWQKINNTNIPNDKLIQSNELKKAIQDDLKRIHNENNLRGFERIADFYLENEEFSTKNNLMTCTFKLQRKNAHSKYQEIIKKMYENLP